MVETVQAGLTIESQPTMETITNCCALVGDIAQCVGPACKSYIATDIIQQMLLYIMNNGNRSEKETAEYAQEHIRRAIAV